jgi:uncharacterized protein YhbP (UPF0306 family)
MEVSELVKHYIHGDAAMMQIATVSDGQPWICTVFYVADNDLNLYWLSWPSRRHSQEIATHKKVAAAIPIKYDKPVIGLQIEGEAVEVTDAETIAMVMKKYTTKYNAGKDFYNNFIAGKNKHHLYRIQPKLFVLFDQVNFPGDDTYEWRP